MRYTQWLWSTLATTAIVGACNSDDDDPDVSIETAAIGANDCGAGSPPWEAIDDGTGGVWRTTIQDTQPGSYGVPPVELAGRIEGEASSSQGTASYRIAIVVPPGRAKMQPSLELKYSSMGGNNVAGVGWTLTGASRIHRCPQTQAQDNQVLPVSYTATDKLCLDGERLVKVDPAATYGAVNTEYRTEIDSFVRVRQLASLDAPTGCFVVEAKSGDVSTYGGCEDPSAAHILPGATAPWAWALRRVVDPRGNDMRYVYAVEDGQHLLRRILYTGTSAGAQGDRKVELEYEARRDVEIGYQSQTPVRSVRRLKAITSEAAGQLTRRYELEYTTSLATRRSLLERVRTCAASTCSAVNQLPATTFSYHHPAPSWQREELPTTDPTRDRYNLVADYDGDGKRDRIKLTYALQSGPGSAGTRTLELSGGSTVNVSGPPWSTAFDLPIDGTPSDVDVDFDNDGRADLEGTINGMFAIGSWNPATRQIDSKTSNLTVTGLVRFRHDFNADGRMDLLVVNNHQYTMYPQCPSSPSNQVAFCAPTIVATLAACDQVSRVVDYDGNGIPDLLVTAMSGCASPPPGPARIIFLSKSGTNVITTTETVTALGGPAGTLNSPTLHSMDVTGDGLLDFVSVSTMSAWINEGGTHRGPVRTHFRTVPLNMTLNLRQRLLDAVIDADIDQDGRAELLYPADITVPWCYIDNQGQAHPPEYCSENPNTFDVGQAPQQNDYTVYRWNAIDLDLDSTGGLVATTRTTNLEAPLKRRIAEDHNGDGLTDIKYILAPLYGATSGNPNTPLGTYQGGPGNGTYIARHLGSAPDLLTIAVDGIGAQAFFSYSALSGTGDSRCTSPIQPFYRANYTAFVPDGVHSLFGSSMHVVSRMDLSNGAGGRNGTCFRYEDAWMHRLGRGFLTFGKTIEQDDVPGDAANNLRRTRLHHRNYPLSGRVFEERSELASDPVAAVPLTRTTTTWASSCTNGRCFPYVDATLTETRDLVSRATVLGTRFTDLVWNTTDLGYGNQTEEHVTVSDPRIIQRTHTVFTYDYSAAAQWWIDRLSRKVETFDGILIPGSPAGQTHVVTTAYEYYTSANGAARLVSWERLQPGDPTMARSTLTVYDGFGNPTSIREEAANAVTRVSSIGYSPDGYFAVRWTNPLLHVSTAVIDKRFGLPTQTTDANNIVTTSTYDLFGRRTQTNRPGLQPIDERMLSCAGASCPARAVLQKLVMQRGAPAVTEYFDVLGRTVRSSATGFANGRAVHVVTEYDARGHQIAKSMPTHTLGAVYYTRYLGFDPLGRPATRVSDAVAGGLPIQLTYRYVGLDTYVRVPQVTNELFRVYDSQKRLLSSRDGAGFTTRYTHDVRGGLAKIVDSDNNEIVSTYDALGRRLTITHPDSGLRTSTYDGFGLLRSETDARNIVTATTYDKLGRPLTRSVANVPNAEWGYDRTFKGAVDYERGGSEGIANYCRGFDYEPTGTLKQSVIFNGTTTLSTEYAEDKNYGRVKGIRYPSRRVIALSYDPAGRLSGESDPGSGLKYREVSEWWPNGQVRTELFGNGLTGEYFIDESSLATTRLWVGRVTAPTMKVQDLNYQYDHLFGFLTRQDNALTGVRETFTYDDLQRVDRAQRTWLGTPATQYTIDHDYSPLGNLVVKSDYSSQTTYGARGRANGANAGPHGIVSYRKPNGTVVNDFLYDNNGNLIAGDGRTASYDAFDKPLQITEAGVQARFAYSPSLDRYKRIIGLKTTHYFDRIHERIENKGAITQRDYIGRTVITKQPNGTEVVLYVHPDRLGSTDTVTDTPTPPALPKAVDWHGSDPFGGPRDKQWVSRSKLLGLTTDRGFTSHEHVDDVSIVHMNGRVYDPRLGRFLSMDPFVLNPGDGQNLNPYSYARNNPMMHTDPTGYIVDADNAKPDPTVVKEKKLYGAPTGSHIQQQIGVRATLSDGRTVTVTMSQLGPKISPILRPHETGGPGQAPAVSGPSVATKFTDPGFFLGLLASTTKPCPGCEGVAPEVIVVSPKIDLFLDLGGQTLFNLAGWGLFFAHFAGPIGSAAALVGQSGLHAVQAGYHGNHASIDEINGNYKEMSGQLAELAWHTANAIAHHSLLVPEAFVTGWDLGANVFNLTRHLKYDGAEPPLPQGGSLGWIVNHEGRLVSAPAAAGQLLHQLRGGEH